MDIYFDNRQTQTEIANEILKHLEKAIYLAIEKENIKIPVEVSVSFVKNKEIQELNKKYRKKDCPTDVLSFPLIDREQLEDGHAPFTIPLGDIIISIPKVIEQAKEYGHSFLRELIYLTVHGMFHLLGYDHINQEEKAIMRNKEEFVMKSINITKNPS
ncbi:rRNA maturation RNase YbeY [Garciella nitratireducens]|uniref:rRNA maturation RNase YbeY n=1 Tax=Garciella nitratireducens TaxID=218205 RepID=UPI001BD248F5|nr:rRNA maturation RNase YbeY [Garciella nitratireducens]